MVYSVFLVDDHPAIRASYHHLIEREPDLYVCGEAETGNEAMTLLQQMAPNVVVLDLIMPGLNGIELIKEINYVYPDCAILVVSGQDELATAIRSLRAGARGYVEKVNTWAITKAIRTVAQGGYYTSQRVMEMVERRNEHIIYRGTSD